MAFAHVQDNNASNVTANQGSIAVTLGSNITSGNLLVAVMYTFDGTFGSPTITSITGGGTWTASDVTVLDGNSNPARLTIGHCSSATGGTATVTANFSNSTDQAQFIWVGEYSGQAAAPLDTTSSNHDAGGNGSTSVTPGSITPAVANELFIAAMYDYTGVSVTQPTGWTIRVNNNGDTSTSVAELISTGSAAQNPVTTLGALNNWAAAMIAFKPLPAPHGLAARLLFVGQSIVNAVSY